MDKAICTAFEKKEKLIALLKQFSRVAVAFSAGVDSTFLLKTAHECLGERVLAITGRSVSFPQREDREASAFCKELNIRHIMVDIDQMAIPGFASNSPERCYLCKKRLFSSFLSAAHDAGFAHLTDGTNADDCGDYRPGLRALQELNVCSPLKEAGLTKAEIRLLSKEAGLSTWDKPAYACLATRIPYGESITTEKLNIIDAAEQYMIEQGFRQVRLRMHGSIARIEIDRSQFYKITEPGMSDSVCQMLHELGFQFITLDLNGYKTGSMNQTMKK